MLLYDLTCYNVTRKHMACCFILLHHIGLYSTLCGVIFYCTILYRITIYAMRLYYVALNPIILFCIAY